MATFFLAAKELSILLAFKKSTKELLPVGLINVLQEIFRASVKLSAFTSFNCVWRKVLTIFKFDESLKKLCRNTKNELTKTTVKTIKTVIIDRNFILFCSNKI